MSSNSSCCAWLQPCLDKAQFREIVLKAAKVLDKEKFDSFICTGYSSSLITGALAFHLGKDIIVVRKDETRNSPHKIEKARGLRAIFVDDCIASGGTFHRVRDACDEADILLVGVYFYFKEPEYHREVLRSLNVRPLN